MRWRISGDGNVVVTGGEDKTVRQFTAAGAKEIRALTGPQAPVASVALAGNNASIAAGSADRHVYLWNAADGKSLGHVLAHAGSVTGVQFHPQGTQLATAGADGVVKVWALPLHAGRTVPHPDGVLAARASTDGKKLYTGSTDKIVRIWDTAKPAIERQFTGPCGAGHRAGGQRQRAASRVRRRRRDHPHLEPAGRQGGRCPHRSRRPHHVARASTRPAISSSRRARTAW